MSEHRNNECGAVMIVEASIVFPIMFIVILLMIMAGNAYLQNSRATYLVSQAAINNAAACANPMLDYVETNNKIPAPGEVDVQPYRYFGNFLSGMSELESKVKRELEQSIGGLETGVFKGMSPQNVHATVEYNPGALCSTFLIKCKFDVVLPIRMIGSSENFKFTYDIQFEQPVNDSTDFVRNRSMAMDYLERSEKAMNAIDKIKEAMGKVAEIIN